MKILSYLCKISNAFTLSLDALSALAALAVRLYLATVFINSGLLKATSWSSTIALFTQEYKVLWISPTLAAYLATAGEIIFPALMVIGLGARFPALGLFILNIIAVVFYPILLTPESECALKDHILWGVLTAIILFYGHGKISIDYLLQKKVCPEYRY